MSDIESKVPIPKTETVGIKRNMLTPSSSGYMIAILTIYLPPCQIILNNRCWGIAHNSPIKSRRVLQFILWKEFFPLHDIHRSEKRDSDRKYFTANQIWLKQVRFNYTGWYHEFWCLLTFCINFKSAIILWLRSN